MRDAAGLLPLVLCLLLAGPLFAAAQPDLLIADFEGGSYGDWVAKGDCFGPAPARGTLAHQNPVSGFLGKGLVNTYYRGDSTTGTLTSPPFRVQRPYINFLVGGGSYPGETCVNLLLAGRSIRTAVGANNELLTWFTWDVSGHLGEEVRIQIVDRHTGGWGHVNVDHIVQSAVPKTTPGGDPESARRRAAEERAKLLPRLREAGVSEIVFALRRVDADGHWYANFSYWSNNPERTLYHDGGRLCCLEVDSGRVRTLLDDPRGGVRDPQVHYDGRKILFSYRRGGQPFYHLYEIGVDGTALRQITDGPYDDIEPTYLPNGDIIFCSSRCNRMVNCYFVRVAVLHRCDADGSHIRPLSANIEQDNTPWVLPDGRILYMRWEYIDRSQVGYHHLWTMNPDGTDQMVYYGNQHPSTVMIDAKPIPGTQQILASFSPGHGRREHAGIITVVDPGAGPDARAFATPLCKGRFLRDPYPVSRDCILVADDHEILVMNGTGQTLPLYRMPDADLADGLLLHEPRPVLPRPRERVIPDQSDLADESGTLILYDVYAGRQMDGVARGDIRDLLVLEALPKPVNFSGGWEPLTYGGSFTLERILGTVPVEVDGSAHFELPAGRSLFFVARDRKGVAVKRMQSFVSVQPGERFSCVGCHEPRTQAPMPGKRPLAARRAPSRIEPLAGVPDVIDFPRDIQPILDRRCVACHDYDASPAGGPRAGGVILTGDRGPYYSHSYVNLIAANQISDGRNLAKSSYPPRAIGSPASPLLKHLDGSHHEVRLTASERQLIRLWIDTAATYPGTYAALGSGMVGSTGWGDREHRVLARRCGSCHRDGKRLPEHPGDNLGIGTTGTVNPKDPRVQRSSHMVFNLSRPAKSLMLLAPLAKEAGGYGLCRAPDAAAEASVFAGTEDVDYQTLLTAITTSSRYLDRIKRFDMPGFRPNIHYLREMQVYGILPRDLRAADPVDPYATDRAYWRSLWHRPADRRTAQAAPPPSAARNTSQ